MGGAPKMTPLKLTLTDEDGIIIEEYSLSDFREYDIEDLDVAPKHDIYVIDGEPIYLDDFIRDLRLHFGQDTMQK